MSLKLVACSIFATILLLGPVNAQDKDKSCFTKEARAEAERTAKVWAPPNPGYDPVLGYNPTSQQRPGALPVDANGVARPMECAANKDPNPGAGTTPKFYCSVPGVVDEDGDLIRYKIKPHFKGQSKEKRNGEIYGEFLSSRFSKALGFFADDEWVADVTCPDCEKSLNKPFQGAPFSGFQPAAGVELPLGKGIDANCSGKDAGGLEDSLETLRKSGTPRAQIDAFKLWLAFIDHGDTKTDNHKFSCLDSKRNADGSRVCKPGQAVFYVSDMGSTFGFSSSSEKKARLDGWSKKDPISVSNGRCVANAKSVGDTTVSEEGRRLLADGLQRLLTAQQTNGMITRVFRASRNAERDQSPEAWTAAFIRKARLIIEATCGN
jgi:hypothetical protein